MRSALKLFSFTALIVSGSVLSSFQDNSTTTTRLGKTHYYIDKPGDCIVKPMMEQKQESSYSVFTDVSSADKCTITIDKEHHERKSKVKIATYFNDDILGHNISIEEYSNGKQFIRTGEIEDNGGFLYFECYGKTKEILEKYYNVVKSLSYKEKAK
ncbi:MAG TPA: hypothetical protein VFJ43_00405 [Bacteroidia bacterium]|nr:hypothetical protein [Bacteroidia bacterium]